MLRQLRQRAHEALEATRRVVLSTDGPAEIQAEALGCEALGLLIYVLVPRASDLLFNLENSALVVVTADTWQARGTGRLLSRAGYPEQLAITRTPDAAWCELVEISPTRLQLRPPSGRGPSETVDIF